VDATDGAGAEAIDWQTDKPTKTVDFCYCMDYVD